MVELTDEKLYPVTFDVSAFSQEVISATENAPQVASAQRKDLKQVIGFLTYMISDTRNNVVSEGSFYASDKDFGSIEISLPEGGSTNPSTYN